MTRSELVAVFVDSGLHPALAEEYASRELGEIGGDDDPPPAVASQPNT